jgi:hypothetical protein
VGGVGLSNIAAGLDELRETHGFHRAADHAVEQRLGRVRAEWCYVERSQMTILDEQGDVIEAYEVIEEAAKL